MIYFIPNVNDILKYIQTQRWRDFKSDRVFTPIYNHVWSMHFVYVFIDNIENNQKSGPRRVFIREGEISDVITDYRAIIRRWFADCFYCRSSVNLTFLSENL